MNVDLLWLRGQFPQLRNLNGLSHGAQKQVFSASHPSYGNIVLKMLHPSQEIHSIERERLAVDRVQSMRVPRIYDTGSTDTPLGKCFWFFEQRIEGWRLRELIARKPLSFAEVTKLALHMLEALENAEKASIVHRDIKPENIICSPLNDYWLLDFGIARHLTLTALTDVSARWGKFTPGYAPPEQFRNIQTEIDNRADLFALGVTLYEAATGENPFWDASNDALDVLRSIERSPLPRLNVPQFSAQFSDFIQALTQRRRDHRPASAKEALEWIREITPATL